ncbi:MAG: glycosyltransferase [Bryobacteraceae bacterium]
MNIPFSVIIATTHAWPELKMTLDSLWPQLQSLGGELIIGDGDGRGIPTDFVTQFPGAVCVTMPGASIFALRSACIQRSRGDIVFLTEDHCVLSENWCAGLLESHRKYPCAAVISGSIENGSADKLMDWANFFIAHGPMMGPVKEGESRHISLSAAAFKRSALPREFPPEGVMEMLYLMELSRQGGKLFNNNKVSVAHVQSFGFWNTFAVHYHNGRSIAGFRKRSAGPWSRLLRIGSCAILPVFLLARSGYGVLRKRRFVSQFLLAFPLMAALATCHAAGELMGYLAGPGNSPAKLS